MSFAAELAKEDAEKLRDDHRVESVNIEGTPEHPKVVVTPTDAVAAGQLEGEDLTKYHTNVVIK